MIVSAESAVCSNLYPNCPANVFDGDADTMWLAGSTQLPQFVAWDLGQVLTVLGIQLVTRDGRLGRLNLLYSYQGLFGPWSTVCLYYI